MKPQFRIDPARRGPAFATALFAAAAALSLAVPARATEFTAPSGLSVTLEEVILDPDTGLARFRFVAPAIGAREETWTYEDVQQDFPVLCSDYALPALRANGWDARGVIISLADRTVEFGVSDPEATQFFENFSIEDGACIWEYF